ncbi:MAG: (2Fe-2S) ferredoxin domain-containing protein [Nitrospirae bacterium]|nr:(2Fe-2S) ferredoxin domain-containing protein [Nitrospirota bacterium]
MPKLTIEDIKKIRDDHKSVVTMREGNARVKIIVHMATCGIAAGARKIMTAIMEEMEKSKVTDVVVMSSGCAGLCSQEPMVTINILDNPPVKYAFLNEEKIKRIFKEHVIEGHIVEDLALVIGSEMSY